MKKAAQQRKDFTQEMTKRFFGNGTGVPTKYDLALELAPDVYALQRGEPASLALKVLLSACLSPANPNATKDDLLRFCILKTPSVNRQTQVYITDLPTEILIMIASFMPKLSDVVKASMTCTQFRDIFWDNNAVFRGWVNQPHVYHDYYSKKPLIFPGVEKTYPELYYRAFLEDPVYVKSKISWKEVAFRWFSWILLFHNCPTMLVSHTKILAADLSVSGEPMTSLQCISTGYRGYNSPLFCANCHRITKRIYAKDTLFVSFNNKMFGFNCMAICGKCWSDSRQSTAVLPIEIVLRVTRLQPNNALLNQRMFHLDLGLNNPYQNYSRYTKGSMVTAETVVYAMLVRWGKLHFDIKYWISQHKGQKGSLFLKTKEAIAAEFEQNWNHLAKKVEKSTLPPPKKKPRLSKLL